MSARAAARPALRAAPNHPPTCFLCAGCGYVCVNHPERPYWSTRLAAACPCDDEGRPCPLGAHGARWFGEVEGLVEWVQSLRPRALRVVGS